MTTLKVYQGKVNRRKAEPVKFEDAKENKWTDFNGNPIDSEHLMISLLIPPAVKEIMRRLDDEVRQLCGKPHERGTDHQRWGSQDGSVVVANQKVRIEKPRVRNTKTGEEAKLKFYEQFQDPELFNREVFTEGMRKVAQRDYTKGVKKIGASFGFTKSSVSRRWIKATESKLKQLNERDLSQLGLVAVFIDGKRFGSRGVVVAMGVGLDGKKYIVGIYECSSENSTACQNLLADLERRGLPEGEILFVVDGGSGLNKALEERYSVHIPEKRRAVRVRCYVHKWRNITETLPEEVQAKAAGLYWGMRDAARLDVAINCADALESLLYDSNQSALRSFREAREDLLNLHKLRMSPGLRKFFSTTNPLESINYMTEEDLRRVKKWHDSHQFQRWLAASSLEAEKRMHRVRGFQNLPALKAALSNMCHTTVEKGVDVMLPTGT